MVIHLDTYADGSPITPSDQRWIARLTVSGIVLSALVLATLILIVALGGELFSLLVLAMIALGYVMVKVGDRLDAWLAARSVRRSRDKSKSVVS